MRTKIILIAILLLGILLRVVNINSNPPALYGDELTIVYDSYSLLKTGQDQLGNPFPLTFEMGAGRPAGYVYGSIPFVAIFGPTALGVRMLSILSGLGIILLLYLLGKKLFEEKIGLAASAITAFSPWDISLSRGGFEAHFALFLVLLATYFFILAKEKPRCYILSALGFGLALHTYPTYKLSLPLFLLLLIWYQGAVKNVLNSKGKLNFFIGLVIFILLSVLAASQTFTGRSEERFGNINIFTQDKLREEIVQKINFERSISQLPQPLLKFFHNKPVEYLKIFGENYLQNFSMDFLVIHGDGHPRHNMATMGQIYLAEFILFFIGLLSYWQKQRKVLTILLLWFFLAPIPTAIVETPHALRSLFMLPPLVIISALGLSILISQKNKIYFIAVMILFLVQFVFFAQKLYFLAPNEYSRFWSYPAKMASKIALDNKNQFNYVILSDKIDNIEFAYPVYLKVDPSLVISQNKHKFALGNYQFKKFDNVYIGYIPDGEVEDFINGLGGSVMFIGTPETSKVLKNFETVEGLDKTTTLVLKRKKS